MRNLLNHFSIMLAKFSACFAHQKLILKKIIRENIMQNGIILLNKPAGISSNSAVNKVKYMLKANKAGHLGTLDVLGEGLLPITINKATKLFDYFLKKDKTYITIFKFGQTSPTLDMEGPLSEEDANLDLQEKDIEQILSKFIGRQNQMPPSYSAKKINGKKAYQLARAGMETNLKPKQIEIYDIKLLKKTAKNTFEFEIDCSSGTFIRAICRDMAKELSTYGVMQRIIRTRCGCFSLKDAVTLKDIEQGNFSVISPEVLFEQPRLDLNQMQFEALQNGRNLQTDEGQFKIFFIKQFLGLGQCEKGKFKMLIRLF